MQQNLELAKKGLDLFCTQKSQSAITKEKHLAADYLSWVEKKTSLILNEKNFTLPVGINIKRGGVFWIDFGYNIDEEYGGKHPGLVLRVGGKTAIVIPLSTQEPTEVQKGSGIYVKIPKVYEFKDMTRWVNVLNATPVSIQRFEFSTVGNVKGYVLDEINEAMDQVGLWKVKKQKTQQKSFVSTVKKEISGKKY